MKRLLIRGALIAAAAGGGWYLADVTAQPACEDPDCVAGAEAEAKPGSGKGAGDSTKPSDTPDYVSLKNQFVVPVIRGERVASLVVLSLSLEIEPGREEGVFLKEPKLRDAFLKAMFDHAHTGGFDGAFTGSERMASLRLALFETGRRVLGEDLRDVLITEIVRQET